MSVCPLGLSFDLDRDLAGDRVEQIEFRTDRHACPHGQARRLGCLILDLGPVRVISRWRLVLRHAGPQSPPALVHRAIDGRPYARRGVLDSPLQGALLSEGAARIGQLRVLPDLPAYPVEQIVERGPDAPLRVKRKVPVDENGLIEDRGLIRDGAELGVLSLRDCRRGVGVRVVTGLRRRGCVENGDLEIIILVAEMLLLPPDRHGHILCRTTEHVDPIGDPGVEVCRVGVAHASGEALKRVVPRIEFVDHCEARLDRRRRRRFPADVRGVVARVVLRTGVQGRRPRGHQRHRVRGEVVHARRHETGTRIDVTRRRRRRPQRRSRACRQQHHDHSPRDRHTTPSRFECSRRYAPDARES